MTWDEPFRRTAGFTDYSHVTHMDRQKDKLHSTDDATTAFRCIADNSCACIAKQVTAVGSYNGVADNSSMDVEHCHDGDS